MKPVDDRSIKSIVQSVKDDCDAFSIALGLERECSEILLCSTTENRFKTLVQAWRRRDKERATLHALMKTLLKISCKDGVDDLVRRYQDILDNSCRLAKKMLY